MDLKRYVGRKFADSGDAEDIVQDTFFNVLKSKNFESVENKRAYLYQTAHNLALNRINRHKKHEDYVSSTVTEEEASTASLERSVAARDDLKRVERAIGRLPPKVQRTFLMSRVDGMTYTQISQELNIATSTVEKHIIRALSFLRDELNREDER